MYGDSELLLCFWGFLVPSGDIVFMTRLCNGDVCRLLHVSCGVRWGNLSSRQNHGLPSLMQFKPSDLQPVACDVPIGEANFIMFELFDH
ncbi:hypothetical protein EJ110_NYTH19645 [Nymphaea thermarum]|nr:hypothetical protein EJ110_NYTH19645 [Nymphaea thermarum]